MANDLTGDRIWVLDTASTSEAISPKPVTIQKVVLLPANPGDAATIKSGVNSSALTTEIVIKAGASDSSPVQLTFFPYRGLQNLWLTSLSTGAVLHIYLV